MPNLILIPTSYERAFVEPQMSRTLAELRRREADWRIELCGFGLVAAAAMATRLINVHRPRRVILIGIAGTLSDRVAVGSAVRFSSVTCHGIGLGEPLGHEYQSADLLGWPQVAQGVGRGEIGDVIELSLRWGESSADTGHHLVSVTSASANREEAISRAVMFPHVDAEDMEGYAVAMACELGGVPLEIVRGISNRTGDRDHASWRVEAALHAARVIAIQLINEA